MYCYFVIGIGELKYLVVQGWELLNKFFIEVLENYNEVNVVMNFVFFDDVMQYV